MSRKKKKEEIQMQNELEYLVFSLVLKSNALSTYPKTLNRIMMVWCAGRSRYCVVRLRKESEI